MKRIRICGHCGQRLHMKKVKGNKWGGSTLTGYFTWLHLNANKYSTCPRMGDVVEL